MSNKFYQFIFIVLLLLTFSTKYEAKVVKQEIGKTEVVEQKKEEIEQNIDEKQKGSGIEIESKKEEIIEKEVKELEKTPYQAYCIGDNVNVRDLNWTFREWDIPVDKTKSYTNYKVIGQLMKGDIVEVEEIKGEWGKIKREKIKGWVAKKYLGPAIKDLVASAIVITNIGIYKRGEYPEIDKALEEYKERESNSKYNEFLEKYYKIYKYGGSISILGDEIKIKNINNEEVIYKIKPEEVINKLEKDSNNIDLSDFKSFYLYAINHKEGNYVIDFNISKTGNYADIGMGDLFFTYEAGIHGLYYKGNLIYTYYVKYDIPPQNCSYFIVKNNNNIEEYVLVNDLIFKDGKVIKDLKPVLKGFSPTYLTIPEENKIVFYSYGNGTLNCTDWDGNIIWNFKNLPKEIVSSLNVNIFEIYTKLENDYYEYIIDLNFGNIFIFKSSLIPVNEGCFLNLVKLNNNIIIIQMRNNNSIILNQALLSYNSKNNIIFKLLSTNDFNIILK